MVPQPDESPQSCVVSEIIAYEGNRTYNMLSTITPAHTTLKMTWVVKPGVTLTN